MKSGRDYVQMIDCVASFCSNTHTHIYKLNFPNRHWYLTLKWNHIFYFYRDQKYSKMGSEWIFYASLALSIICELENAIWSKGSSAVISTVL